VLLVHFCNKPFVSGREKTCDVALFVFKPSNSVYGECVSLLGLGNDAGIVNELEIRWW
jgi:hypothetical protein